jgi:hypothetical protein
MSRMLFTKSGLGSFGVVSSPGTPLDSKSKNDRAVTAAVEVVAVDGFMSISRAAFSITQFKRFESGTYGKTYLMFGALLL